MGLSEEGASGGATAGAPRRPAGARRRASHCSRRNCPAEPSSSERGETSWIDRPAGGGRGPGRTTYGKGGPAARAMAICSAPSVCLCEGARSGDRCSAMAAMHCPLAKSRGCNRCRGLAWRAAGERERAAHQPNIAALRGGFTTNCSLNRSSAGAAVAVESEPPARRASAAGSVERMACATAAWRAADAAVPAATSTAVARAAWYATALVRAALRSGTCVPRGEGCIGEGGAAPQALHASDDRQAGGANGGAALPARHVQRERVYNAVQVCVDSLAARRPARALRSEQRAASRVTGSAVFLVFCGVTAALLAAGEVRVARKCGASRGRRARVAPARRTRHAALRARAPAAPPLGRPTWRAGVGFAGVPHNGTREGSGSLRVGPFRRRRMRVAWRQGSFAPAGGRDRGVHTRLRHGASHHAEEALRQRSDARRRARRGVLLEHARSGGFPLGGRSPLTRTPRPPACTSTCTVRTPLLRRCCATRPS